jgi:hypothetical protein
MKKKAEYWPFLNSNGMWVVAKDVSDLIADKFLPNKCVYILYTCLSY